MALNLSLLPADVQKAIAANPDLFKRSTTAARDRANSLTFNASSEGGQTTGYGANVGGGGSGTLFTELNNTWNGQGLLDYAGTPWTPLDNTIDFTDKAKWLPGAEQAVLGATKWDDKLGLLADYGVMDKWGLAPKATFMDKLVPALILSAVGMGAGQMFQAANAGGFLPAAQSGFDSTAIFSGGAGGVQGGAAGAVAGGGGGGVGNVAGRVAGNTAGGIVPGGASASSVIGGANPAIVAQTAAEASFIDGLAVAAGGGASITDTIKNIYNTVKPYKDALSIAQTGASIIQGVNNRNATADAADKQAETAAEQLRQQQAAQAAQEEAARQALELQRQAQEKLLAQQNAQLQEQLRLQQSMASYQQQVYSQQLAQAANDAKRAEEQLRRNSQRNPDFASVVSGNRRAGASGVGGTMLTGSGGVDPTSLLLGRATLLGG